MGAAGHAQLGLRGKWSPESGLHASSNVGAGYSEPTIVDFEFRAFPTRKTATINIRTSDMIDLSELGYLLRFDARVACMWL